MRDKYTKEDDDKIEKAIEYLVNEYVKSGTNPKPVNFHSIKVALYLYDLNYSEDVVVAAVLHDLIEDTEVSHIEITQKFGSKIGKMVENLSFKPEILDKQAQYLELFERTKRGGRDLLIIKCADIYQNSFYVTNDLSGKDYFVQKMKYFLEISKEMIGEEKPWKDLSKRLKSIVTYV